mgnify:CR=1 FL=1
MTDTNIVELREGYLRALREGVCKVIFTKKDGTDRRMLCTLDMSGIPEKDVPKTDGNVTAVNTESVRVYDLEVEGWRSFRIDSVKEFAAV